MTQARIYTVATGPQTGTYAGKPVGLLTPRGQYQPAGLVVIEGPEFWRWELSAEWQHVADGAEFVAALAIDSGVLILWRWPA